MEALLGELAAFFAQVDHLCSHADNQRQREAALCAEQHGGLQVCYERVPVGHAAQCFGDGGHHQEKRGQTQEDCFQVCACAAQPGYVPCCISGREQGNGDDAYDVAHWLFGDQEYAEGADQH